LFDKERDVIINEYSIELNDLIGKLSNEYKNTSVFNDLTDLEYY
jgi:hypothetical protein